MRDRKGCVSCVIDLVVRIDRLSRRTTVAHVAAIEKNFVLSYIHAKLVLSRAIRIHDYEYFIA